MSMMASSSNDEPIYLFSRYASPFSAMAKSFCKLSPLWTVLSASIAVRYSSQLDSTIGSLRVMQYALSILMLAMGLTITPDDVSRAIKKPSIIISNVLLCFGMMPLLSVGIANVLRLSDDYKAGLVLLGCVSGGQASNLFALLAGGDVALSVACTLSTTLLGVVAIPLLVKYFLNCIVVVDGIGVLESVSSLVLLPLLIGLGVGKAMPSLVKRLESIFPLVGVLATLILVAGGASNSVATSSINATLASYLLPLLGGAVALLASHIEIGGTESMDDASRRTLVVETLSKSPTLAYVLAKKHFGQYAAAIPASGMVSLAVVGAAVASTWSMLDPIENTK